MLNWQSSHKHTGICALAYAPGAALTGAGGEGDEKLHFDFTDENSWMHSKLKQMLKNEYKFNFYDKKKRPIYIYQSWFSVLY